MKPALDFSSKGFTFDIYAYDVRAEMAVLKNIDNDLKPYKVVTGFKYKFDYDYENMFSFSTLDEAFGIYDVIIKAKGETK